MHVALVNLTNSSLSGGYRKYLQKLLPLLCATPYVSQADIFVHPQIENLVGLKLYSLLSWPVNDHRMGFPWLKAKIKELAPDVVFIPTAQWIGCGKTPVVTMIRNMEPFVTPFGGNPLIESIKNIGRAFIAKRSCMKATRIIAVSEYVKKYLIERWKIDETRLGVVYHGVDMPDESLHTVIPETLRKYDLGGFVFTSGSIRPARGLEDLLRAFGHLRGTGNKVKLVIAGNVDPRMEDYKRKLERTANELGISTDVIWAGYLTENEMSWCYQNCKAFIMTSRAEACPNIVLEAMAHGCACISTETQPMPEFFGDVAVHYPPQNWKELAEKIKTMLSWGENKRQEVSKRAKSRAAQFSWDVCAEKTVAELAKAVKGFNKLESR